MPDRNTRPEDQGQEAPRPSLSGLLFLGLAVLFCCMLITGGHLMSPDGELLYRMSESLAFGGTTQVLPLEADLVTGQLPEGLPPQYTFATKMGREEGTFFAQYLPLQPLLSAPFLWVARALEGALAEPFARVMWPSMTISYLTPLPSETYARAVFRRGFLVLLFNPIITALSAILLARLTTLLTYSRSAGLWVGALWAFGTMAWPHSRTYFTEPLAGLLALYALDQLCRWTMTPIGKGTRYAIGAGVALGLANWTRVDSPFFTVGLVGMMTAMGAWKFLREESYARVDRPSPLPEILITGCISLGAWLLLQGFNYLRFGGDITSGYGDQSEGVKFSTPILVGLHGLFCSPGKGLFFFSPALILGLWGWVKVPFHLRWLRFFVFVGYLPFFLAMAMWQNWDGGWCWGPRHVVQIHLPIMLGAGFLFLGHVSILRRLAIYAVLGVSAIVQLYGSSQNPLDYYREYFQTFEDMEYYRVNLTPIQVNDITREYVLRPVSSTGEEGDPVNPGLFPAPMIDSLYLPQHTQWAAYRQMWRFGYCDWYWWNMMRSGRGPDRWDEAP